MEKIKNLLNTCMNEPTAENRNELINETWVWLVNEYDRTDRTHVILLTAIKNAITFTN